jgi:hypothetical protein
VIGWITESKSNNSEDNPLVYCSSVQGVKRYKEGQCPELPYNSVEGKPTSPICESGKKQKIRYRYNLTGNYQEIGLKSCESEAFETVFYY